MNLASIIILVLVLALLALALRTYFSKGHCGGGSACSSCAGCSTRELCHRKPS